MVGRGGRVLIQRAFAAEGRQVDGAELERLFTAFTDHYAAHVAEESRPFPGVEAALDRFAGAGWLLAVCTNKAHPLVRPLMEALGLAPRFAAMVGQGALPWLKPDARVFAETVRLAGGTPGARRHGGRFARPTSRPRGRRACRWWRSPSAIRRSRWPRSAPTG